MAKLQMDAVLRLVDVQINPKVFSQISRAVAGMPKSMQQTGKATQQATQNVQQLNAATKKTKQNLSGMNRLARQFLQRMAQFAILLPTFATLNKAIQGGVKFLVDFETQLTNILRIDIQGLSGRLDEVADAAFRIGKEFGASADQVIGSIKLFKQAGDTIEDSISRAEAATLATRVTTLDLASAQETLISVSRQFKDEALSDIDVIDKLAAIEDSAAVQAQDLADAFRTGGNALAFFAGSFDEANALIAAFIEQTRKSGREAGTFFKTLQTRLFAGGDPRKAVEGLGVALEDLNGKLRPTGDIIEELVASFEKLGPTQAATAAKAIAGVRQFEGLLGALKSVDKQNQLVGVSTDSAGRAFEKLAVIEGRLEDLNNKVIASFQELANALGKAGVTDFFKDALLSARGLANALTGMVDIASSIGVPLGPLLGVGAIKIGQVVFGIGQNLAKASTTAATAINNLAASANAAAGATAANAAASGGSMFGIGGQKGGLIRGARGGINKFFGGAGGGIGGPGAAKFAKLFLISTTVATGLNALSSAIDGSIKEFDSVGEKSVKNLGSNFAKAGATAAQFAILGAPAALLAGTFSLIVSSGADVVKAFQENAKLNKEIADFRKTEKERTAFLEGDFDTTAIAESILDTIRQAGGKINGEVLDKIEADVKASDIAKGFKDFDLSKELLTGPVLAKIFRGADAFADIGIEIDNSNTPMKTFREEIAKLTGIFAVTNEETGVVTQGIKSFIESIDDLDRFAKLAETEKEFLDLRRQLAETGDVANKLFKSEIQTRREELEAVRNFQSQANRLISDLVEKAATKPGDFDFFKDNAPEKAVRFIADVQKRMLDFIQAGGTLDSEDFRTKFRDIIANASEGQTDLINRVFDITKMSIEEELKLRKSRDALVMAQAEFDLDAVKRRFAAEQAAAKATEDINKSLIDLGLSAGATVQDIDAFVDGFKALSKVEQAEEDLRTTREKNILHTKNLQKSLEGVTTDINSLSASQDTSRASGQKLNELLKKRDELQLDIDNRAKKSRIEIAGAEIALAQARTEATAEAIEANEKLRESLEELAQSESDFNNELEESLNEFNKFKEGRLDDLFGDLADAQSSLTDAQSEVIASTEELADVYKDFLDSILAFNDGVASARVEANLIAIDIDRLGGGLAGFGDRLSAIDTAFNNVLANANISLEKRIELERQLAEETLQFLQQTRQEIVSAGLEIFGQDSSANRDLQEGISGLRIVAEKLGGSFDNFLNLGEEQFRLISQELLNLPVDLRQKILDALGTLPSTVGVGGFSVEELRTALGQVGAGISPEVGLPSVEELLSQEAEQLTRLQDLAIRDAELQIAQVIAAKEALDVAEAQLEETMIAEERAREAIAAVEQQLIDENAALDRAEAQRDILTQALINAEDAATTRAIQDQARELQTQTKADREIGNQIVQSIDSLAGSIRGILEARASIPGIPGEARGFIPNFAGGRLSPGEAAGLLRAAQREKRMMPNGAGLAVANTSEAIIPMRAGGFVPNFAGGNGRGSSDISAGINSVRGINETVVAAIARSVTVALSNLDTNGQVNGELTRMMEERLTRVIAELENLNDSNVSIDGRLEQSVANNDSAVSPAGLNDVNINVNANQNSTVQVQGLSDLESALRQAITEAQQQQVNAATVPITEAIQNIFTVLRERGLISSFGQGL